MPAEGGPRPLAVSVQRGSVLEGARRALGGAGAGMKARLAVTFRDAHGSLEAGLDQGGLTKELLEEVPTFIQQLPWSACW